MRSPDSSNQSRSSKYFDIIRPLIAPTVIERRDGRSCTSYWTFAKGVTRILIGAQKGVEERSLYWLESHWATPSLTLAVTPGSAGSRELRAAVLTRWIGMGSDP
jgi:hypothetical protein